MSNIHDFYSFLLALLFSPCRIYYIIAPFFFFVKQIIIVRSVVSHLCRLDGALTGRYLDAIGEVVYYGDVPALADTVVLDPRWLTVEVLGPVLAPSVENLQSIFARGVRANPDGSIPRGDLLSVLGPAGQPLPAALAEKVLGLMCKMELCLEYKGSVLVPALLTVGSGESVCVRVCLCVYLCGCCVYLSCLGVCVCVSIF